MNPLPVNPLKITSTPLSAPAFTGGKHRFLDREYFNIIYRTDPDAFRAAVPEPLVTEDPLVRFEVMHMGDVDGFGPYTECGLCLSASFDGEHGEFLHSMYLDNFGATAAGREGGVYPKAMGTPRIFTEPGVLAGTLDFGSFRIANATMAYKNRPISDERATEIIGQPTWAVKTVRGYDGRPIVADLTRTQITDFTVKWAFEGAARLQLFDHVLAPLADLPVNEIVHASHIMTDMTLAPFAPVHNYLEG